MIKPLVITMKFVSLIIHGLLATISLCKIIKIEDGSILGTIMETRSGVLFNAFLQIPYAAPPIIGLRFRAPIPNQPWSGILNGTVYGPKCMQAGTFVSEDCLKLNVFTKTVHDKQILRPVIVYFRSFEVGTVISHGPDYLMDRDIVLVTVQYRLAAFGFMGVGTADVSGNQGFKDQSLALRWIHKNIHHFGGDRKKVTISGYTSASSSFHIVSPMSQGLFHNVIGISQSMATRRRLDSNNTNTVMWLARRVNCTTVTTESMIRCLRNTSAQVITDNLAMAIEIPCPILTWAPLVEPDLGQERFITEDPIVSFRRGNFSKVNVIMGRTSLEYIRPAAEILSNPNATAYLNENWNEVAPICFSLQGNEFTTIEEMAAILKKSYFPFDIIDIRSFNNLNNLFSDSMIGYGIHKFVHLVSALIDVYYYQFSYVGETSTFNFPRNAPFGVNHGDDAQYVFNNSLQGIPLTHPDSFVVERMTRIWEQFAWTGNPNNQTDEYLEDMVWPRHDNATEWYLDIGNHLVEKNGLFLERFAIWDNFETNSTSFV